MQTQGQDILVTAAELKQRREAFVLATVVRSRRPTSARPGARAIVYPNGRLEGWVGGSCARPLVVREALRALADGVPRLLRLRGEGQQALDAVEEGVVDYPMTCSSGGTLEIYVEPHLPPPILIVVGHSPTARALVELGSFMGFRVTAVAPEATSEDFPGAEAVLQSLDGVGSDTLGASYLVVAGAGEDDELALEGEDDELALEGAAIANPPYLAVVASRRRGEALRDYLRGSGLSDDSLSRLKVPAGLDLGAVEPNEIALSIMAEIVQCRRTARGALSAQATRERQKAEPATAIDPICGMVVEIATTRHSAEVDGQKLYFCCPACKRSFLAASEFATNRST
jgi:xanthine dehydrogenase accessory factor